MIKLKLDKEEFMESDLGKELINCLTRLDEALDKRRDEIIISSFLARWEVYQMIFRQYYGMEYCFTRTDEYYGVVTEDEKDWLFRVLKKSSERL